jgi:hypothetical protein
MTDLKKFKIAGDAVLAALDAARDAYAARDANPANVAAVAEANAASAVVRDTYATYNAILAAQDKEKNDA